MMLRVGVIYGNLRAFMLKEPDIFSIYHNVKVRAQLEKVPWGRLGFI
jgi:hypothetical protein